MSKGAYSREVLADLDAALEIGDEKGSLEYGRLMGDDVDVDGWHEALEEVADSLKYFLLVERRRRQAVRDISVLVSAIAEFFDAMQALETGTRHEILAADAAGETFKAVLLDIIARYNLEGADNAAADVA